MKNLDAILKLITGNSDSEVKQEAFSSIQNDEDSKKIFRKAKTAWALMAATKKMPDYQVEESYRTLQARIANIQSKFLIRSFLKFAAVITIAISLSTLTYYLGRQNAGNIRAELKYISVEAALGQKSKIILPDSSVVWLNSGSILTYNSRYSFDNRNLNLSGQAFLEVRKNPKLPLVVVSGDLRVKVLGTKFDVKAYPDDNMIKVILESGKVELLSKVDSSFKHQLKPGEMAEYETKSGKIAVKTIDPLKYSNWKEGDLIFMDTPMAEVLKSLERKFDVKIEVLNQKVLKSVFNAKFKNESLKEILDYIHFACSVNYTLEPASELKKARVIIN